MKDVSTFLIFVNSRRSSSRHGKLNWNCQSLGVFPKFICFHLPATTNRQDAFGLEETTHEAPYTNDQRNFTSWSSKGTTLLEHLYHLKHTWSLHFAEIDRLHRLENLSSVYQGLWQETEKADKECSSSFHLQGYHHESLWSQPHHRSIGSTYDQIWFNVLDLSFDH